MCIMNQFASTLLSPFPGSFSTLLKSRPGPSSRTRRSAIKARKSIVTRTTRDSVERTDKTIQTIKRHRKQRHAKLKEMAKEDEEGNSIRDSWFTGSEIVCPVCSATVRGDGDVVDAHIDACLTHENRRQEEARHRELYRRAIEEAVLDEDGEGPGNYVGDLRGQSYEDSQKWKLKSNTFRSWFSYSQPQ